ncbi:hypothetical protein [Microbacterium marinilacus]|uniref:DUF308 domain-containing protein n=1 Tax=Microbacterium marinilacus TaxID=415209 RepID=A0ABP7BDN4_9MICO|nr:hypothetical protein [Microbacterium marinilacus]MBY0688988.1 hypothetical protein [Microbacterium marinilacus]
MTIPELAPRRRYGGVAATWAFGLAAAIAIGVFVPFAARFGWLGVAGGACVVFAFVAQLVDGRARGFVFRVGVAAVGALGILGAVSFALALAAITVV